MLLPFEAEESIESSACTCIATSSFSSRLGSGPLACTLSRSMVFIINPIKSLGNRVKKEQIRCSTSVRSRLPPIHRLGPRDPARWSHQALEQLHCVHPSSPPSGHRLIHPHSHRISDSVPGSHTASAPAVHPACGRSCRDVFSPDLPSRSIHHRDRAYLSPRRGFSVRAGLPPEILAEFSAAGQWMRLWSIHSLAATVPIP